MGIEERRHIRIKYPKEARGTLVAKAPHPIIDISESGCKFQSPNLNAYAVGEAVKGALKLISGVGQAFEGKIVRKVADLVMVQFYTPIPRDILAAEVDFLIAHFGKFEEATKY